jgi:hypothetical protein
MPGSKNVYWMLSLENLQDSVYRTNEKSLVQGQGTITAIFLPLGIKSKKSLDPGL